MLGKLTLHGDNQIVLPNHFVAKDEGLARTIAPTPPRRWGRDDGSFWFTKRA